MPGRDAGPYFDTERLWRPLLVCKTLTEIWVLLKDVCIVLLTSLAGGSGSVVSVDS